MNTEQTSTAVLDHEYLTVRAKILEIAASLDRIQRARGSETEQPRLNQLRTAIESLLESGAGRAERVQLLFSRPYDDQWRKTFNFSR